MITGTKMETKPPTSPSTGSEVSFAESTVSHSSSASSEAKIGKSHFKVKGSGNVESDTATPITDFHKTTEQLKEYSGMDNNRRQHKTGRSFRRAKKAAEAKAKKTAEAKAKEAKEQITRITQDVKLLLKNDQTTTDVILPNGKAVTLSSEGERARFKSLVAVIKEYKFNISDAEMTKSIPEHLVPDSKQKKALFQQICDELEAESKAEAERDSIYSSSLHPSEDSGISSSHPSEDSGISSDREEDILRPGETRL